MKSNAGGSAPPERDEAVEAAAKDSWRIRRRIKRLLLGWLVVSAFFAEAAVSWFGIFLATHAPMPLADAKVIAERTGTVILVASFLVMVLSIALQFRARQRLRRLERAKAQRLGLASGVVTPISN